MKCNRICETKNNPKIDKNMSYNVITKLNAILKYNDLTKIMSYEIKL